MGHWYTWPGSDNKTTTKIRNRHNKIQRRLLSFNIEVNIIKILALYFNFVNKYWTWNSYQAIQSQTSFVKNAIFLQRIQKIKINQKYEF